MKSLLMLGFILSFSSFADVWKKPPYTADENHIPQKEIQREEAQERQEAKVKKHHTKKKKHHKKIKKHQEPK